MWERYPIGGRPLGWMELSENGWGAIASWFAGPENVVREPMGERTDLIRVTCELADGTVKSFTETITEAEVPGIENDIDAYLEDSGLPARPHGFRWFLKLPANVQDAEMFWRLLVEADMRMPRTHRDAVLEAENLGTTIKGLYARKF